MERIYENTRVIFLDIDGVLNVITQGRDEFGSTFHSHLVDNLRLIIEATGAKIVISSSWRASGLKKMKEMWLKRGLPGEVIGITPFGDGIRGEEIAEWFKLNKVLTYCILDDDDDMLASQKENFVKCSDNPNHEGAIDIGYGLTKECAARAIEILNKQTQPGYLLFLDDFRVPVDCARYMYTRGVDCKIYHKEWVIVRSYGQFVKWIERNGLPEFVSFDYDLCDVTQLKEELPTWEWFDMDNNREYTGLDCAKWLIKYCRTNNIHLPQYAIHSSNPDGTQDLKKELRKFVEKS